MSTGFQEEKTLSRDDVFEVLSNSRRRHALRYLRRNGGPVEVGELAEIVAAREEDKRVEEVTSRERKRVYVALKQSHLPRMKEVELVERGSDGVRLTDNARNLDLYLEIVPSNSMNWSQYYLAASALSGLLVVGSGFRLFPFNFLPSAAWAGAVTALFLAIAVAHVLHDRRMKLGVSGH